MLGGESTVTVLCLGRSGVWNDRFGAPQTPSIYKNLTWVGRMRMVSAVSRPKRHLIVLAPKVTLSADRIIKIYSHREWRAGREFFAGSLFQESSYTLNAEGLMKVMADYKPRDRASDLGVHLRNAITCHGFIPPNFVFEYKNIMPSTRTRGPDAVMDDDDDDDEEVEEEGELASVETKIAYEEEDEDDLTIFD